MTASSITPTVTPAVPPTVAKGLKVALFAACYNDTMWPGTPIAVVKLLERLGCRVGWRVRRTSSGAGRRG